MRKKWDGSTSIIPCATDVSQCVPSNDLVSTVLIAMAVVVIKMKSSLCVSGNVCRATRIKYVSALLVCVLVFYICIEIYHAFETICSPRSVVA